MKRLIPFLILAAFFVGISGNGVGRSYVTHKIRTCHQSHPQLAKYLPCEDNSGSWDAADQPVSALGNIIYPSKPSRLELLPWQCPGLKAPTQYTVAGLGCGGIPS
jgi:hypothetical protein